MVTLLSELLDQMNDGSNFETSLDNMMLDDIEREDLTEHLLIYLVIGNL